MQGVARDSVITVLLADDHSVILDGLAAILTQEGFSVVGLAASGSQAVELYVRLRPDVALIDLRLPDMSGIQCIRLIRQRVPDAKIALLSSFDNPAEVQESLAAGAKGYLVKDVTRSVLARTLRDIHQVTPVGSILGEPEGPHRHFGLTARENQILQLLARGQANKSIAVELSITVGTVKLHLYKIYKKLGVSSRTEAMRVAMERGLILFRSR